MSADSTREQGTTMAEQGIFFKLHLNPDTERDRAIIVWIKAIRKQKRAQKIKQALRNGIDGNIAQQEPTRSRSMTFQFFISYKRDHWMITWLEKIPQRMRCRKMKQVLSRVIPSSPLSSPIRSHTPQLEAREMAKRFFGSIKKSQSE